MEPVILGMETYVLSKRYLVLAAVPPRLDAFRDWLVIARHIDLKRNFLAPWTADQWPDGPPFRWRLVHWYDHEPAHWRAQADVTAYLTKLGYT